MVNYRTLLLPWILLFLGPFFGRQLFAAGQIALSFDDAPRSDTHYYTGRIRTQRLISSLGNVKVQRAVFFCNTSQFHLDENRTRIETYARNGHLIGNHSHEHLDLHQVSIERFLSGIWIADEHLKEIDGFFPYFRFPYLREGLDEEMRDTVRAALRNRGYKHGYVTVDTYDWYMDQLFQQALKSGQKVDWEKLRTTYIQVLWDGIQFYEKIAREELRRNVKHILLLHENDLAALFVDDLVTFLRHQDWEIISAEDAYSDPIAAIEPQTLQLGQGRVAALAAAAGYRGNLRSKWESEESLKQLFHTNRIFVEHETP